MFAKVFTQILDSSLANDYQVRHVFEDLLKLADINGVVDCTVESIARRTNVPVEIVAKGISALEKPDASSRTPDHEGRRIVRIDDHRDWGWLIVNYNYYREIASEAQRREKTRKRVQKFRKGHDDHDALRNACNGDVTHGNACNASCNDSPSTSAYASPSVSVPDCTLPVQSVDMDVYNKLKAGLIEFYKRTSQRFVYEEERMLLEICGRTGVMAEFSELKTFRPKTKYFPESIPRLLRDWNATLDRSRNQSVPVKEKTLMDKELEEIKRLCKS